MIFLLEDILYEISTNKPNQSFYKCDKLGILEHKRLTF